MSHAVTPQGQLSIARISAPPARDAVRTVDDARKAMEPRWRQHPEIAAFKRANAETIQRSLHDMNEFAEKRLPFLGQLWLRKVSAERVVDYGLVSCRVVTTAGVAYIVDAWQNLVELENMRFHGVGTGTTAEAASQTALTSELTTQYSTANTRPTGSLGEQSGQVNVFETSATVTVSSGVALTEHGIFSTAGSGTGVLMDRSVFAAVNLASGESLSSTWRLSVPAGS